jgi:hypothetical protein
MIEKDMWEGALIGEIYDPMYFSDISPNERLAQKEAAMERMRDQVDLQAFEEEEMKEEADAKEAEAEKAKLEEEEWQRKGVEASGENAEPKDALFGGDEGAQDMAAAAEPSRRGSIFGSPMGSALGSQLGGGSKGTEKDKDKEKEDPSSNPLRRLQDRLSNRAKKGEAKDGEGHHKARGHFEKEAAADEKRKQHDRRKSQMLQQQMGGFARRDSIKGLKTPGGNKRGSVVAGKGGEKQGGAMQWSSWGEKNQEGLAAIPQDGNEAAGEEVQKGEEVKKGDELKKGGGLFGSYSNEKGDAPAPAPSRQSALDMLQQRLHIKKAGDEKAKEGPMDAGALGEKNPAVKELHKREAWDGNERMGQNAQGRGDAMNKLHERLAARAKEKASQEEEKKKQKATKNKEKDIERQAKVEEKARKEEEEAKAKEEKHAAQLARGASGGARGGLFGSKKTETSAEGGDGGEGAGGVISRGRGKTREDALSVLQSRLAMKSSGPAKDAPLDATAAVGGGEKEGAGAKPKGKAKLYRVKKGKATAAGGAAAALALPKQEKTKLDDGFFAGSNPSAGSEEQVATKNRRALI